MNALPVPNAIAFRTSMSATGVGLQLSDEDGEARLLLGLGRGFRHDATWQTQIAPGGKATVTTPSNVVLEATSPIFNPTGSGAFDWLRYGLRGSTVSPPAVKSGTTVPAVVPITDGASGTAPQRSSDLPTIGRIQAIGTAFYHVEDAGVEACPSGSNGRHLHLTAWRDPQTHPVTDVGVDTSSNRICMLRFNLGNASALSLTGSYELHFDNVDGYWLVVAGQSHLPYRVFGLGAKREALHVNYDQTTLG